MLSTVGKTVLYTIGEVLLVLIISTPLIVLQFTEPFQSGFFPNDQSISYPKRPNTISLIWAGFFGLAAPLLAIFALEIYLAYNERFPKYQGTNIPMIFIQFYRLIGLLALSFLSMLLIVQVGKETLGSLRPFFLEACQPTNNVGGYQSVIDCSSANDREINEARMSFPSGHSSCAAWGAAMTSIYLQNRFPKCPAPMLKAFLQVAVTVIAFYICLTRIQDNWHRPVDVIVGALLGIAAAVMVFLVPVGERLILDSRSSSDSVSE